MKPKYPSASHTRIVREPQQQIDPHAFGGRTVAVAAALAAVAVQQQSRGAHQYGDRVIDEQRVSVARRRYAQRAQGGRRLLLSTGTGF